MSADKSLAMRCRARPHPRLVQFDGIAAHPRLDPSFLEHPNAVRHDRVASRAPRYYSPCVEGARCAIMTSRAPAQSGCSDPEASIRSCVIESLDQLRRLPAQAGCLTPCFTMNDEDFSGASATSILLASLRGIPHIYHSCAKCPQLWELQYGGDENPRVRQGASICAESSFQACLCAVRKSLQGRDVEPDADWAWSVDGWHASMRMASLMRQFLMIRKNLRQHFRNRPGIAAPKAPLWAAMDSNEEITCRCCEKAIVALTRRHFARVLRH